MDTQLMNFSEALKFLKQDKRLARRGWNGKGMFVFLVDGSKFEVNRAPLDRFYEKGTEVEYRPHLDMKVADGTIGVWTPSNADILAADWFICEKE